MKESQEYLVAEDLICRFYLTRGKRPLFWFWKDTTQAKRQAKICVEEMINAVKAAGIVAGDQLDFYNQVLKQIPIVGI